MSLWDIEEEEGEQIASLCTVSWQVWYGEYVLYVYYINMYLMCTYRSAGDKAAATHA